MNNNAYNPLVIKSLMRRYDISEEKANDVMAALTQALTMKLAMEFGDKPHTLMQVGNSMKRFYRDEAPGIIKATIENSI